jgi:hypothetical protein
MSSLKKNYQKTCLNLSYDFSKFDGSRKIKGDVPSGPAKYAFANLGTIKW